MTAETDLQAALTGHDLAALRQLTTRGTDLNTARVTTDAGPRSPLEHALSLGDAELVTGLLALPGVTAAASLPADRFWAWAREAPLAVIKAFLDRSGVPADHRDAAGRTVLHAVAAGTADPATVRFLLERVPADQPAEDGTTPFFHAAVGGHVESAGLLRAAGADPNAATKEDGWTALITMAAAGTDVGWLLGTAGVDVNRADREGSTALHVATVEPARPALGQLLADRRTDRTVRDRWGLTPLMLAAQQDDAATTALLLAGGGDTGENLVDVDRATALHHAVLAGSDGAVEALLARPALNLAGTDRDGRTAAQLARETDQTAIVALLAAADRADGRQHAPAAEPPPRPPEPELPDPHHQPSIVDVVEPVRLRRLPVEDGVVPLVQPDAVDRDLHVEGLARAVQRAQQSLTDAEQEVIVKQVTSVPRYAEASRADQLRLRLAALHAHHPATVLGDPRLIECGPRPRTRDSANIIRMVYKARNVIGQILTGTRDVSLARVFGSANVPLAKHRYQAARIRMHQLARAGRIVTDRSGYGREAGFSGAATANQISLDATIIDRTSGSPTAALQLIHEAMHAGNPTVNDYGYSYEPSFLTLAEDVKLNNAAHYEVVPAMMMDLHHPYEGQLFVPAVAAAAAPPGDAERARREASERLRRAWTTAINLHNLWVQVFRKPAVWFTHDPAAYRGAAVALANSLPYWSAVERLTVHRRAGRDRVAPNPSQAPVTLVDVALSEGVIRLLNLTRMRAAVRLRTDGTMAELLRARATDEERSAAERGGVPALTDLAVRCLRRDVGEITGAEDRDLRVITALAAGHPDDNDWREILTAHPFDTFPD